MLQALLCKIVAMRGSNPLLSSTAAIDDSAAATLQTIREGTVLDKVLELITAPSQAATYQQDPESVILDPKVKEQLHQYVMEIASKYRDNSYHSFGHACHVTQSVIKLLARVVSPALDKGQEHLHEYTYGIASGPLTQFASAFLALVHNTMGCPITNWSKRGATLPQCITTRVSPSKTW
jgi:hypothetical protein